ncbi:MAG TPA: DUF6152 family protein [Vicinamibacterales bacterium]|nr:DUF6152 family protein [Vicinamibacterales bacterium]
MRVATSVVVVIACCLMGLVPVRAHHSGSEYTGETIEIEGTLLEVAWQNPHVHFFVRAKDQKGVTVTWDIEANSLSILRRTDATPENLKVGDKVKVAGSPSRRAPNRMWAMNILAANGKEIVLGPGIKPRWATNAAGEKSTWFEGGTDANKTAGIFRVWSTKFNEPGGLWRRDYPLTDAAKKARASFNPLTDSVAPGCRPKGMPTIMEQPYPLEFVKKGVDILLRMEEYDTVRTIVMTPDAKFDALPKTLLGRSKGKWEAETLVVTTNRIDWAYFDPSGIRQGPSSSIVERFTPSPDGTRLNYTMTITDPATFTAPLELKRSWVWRSGETVKPYNCVERKGRS